MSRWMIFAALCACSGPAEPPAEEPRDAPVADTNGEADVMESDSAPSDTAQSDSAQGSSDANTIALAHVIAVEARGSDFAVTIESPDTGCDQYANWWEVLREDGSLLYRRILGHSHVDEQPFTRSGGPISSDEVVIVRAHMHPGGYGGTALRGNTEMGFERADDIDAAFAAARANEEPLPESCAF